MSNDIREHFSSSKLAIIRQHPWAAYFLHKGCSKSVNHHAESRVGEPWTITIHADVPHSVYSVSILPLWIQPPSAHKAQLRSNVANMQGVFLPDVQRNIQNRRLRYWCGQSREGQRRPQGSNVRYFGGVVEAYDASFQEKSMTVQAFHADRTQDDFYVHVHIPYSILPHPLPPSIQARPDGRTRHLCQYHIVDNYEMNNCEGKPSSQCSCFNQCPFHHSPPPRRAFAPG